MFRLFAAVALAGAGLTPVRADDPPAKTDTKPAVERPAVDLNQISTTGAINHFLAQGWEKAGIKKPAAPATDDEFLRRAFIDLLGRIATPEEVTDFEQDRSPNKRAKLVKRLIYGVPQTKNGQPERDKDGKPVMGAYKPAGAKEGFDYADEFAEHWAAVWTNWLMSRTTHPFYRDSLREWLHTQFYLHDLRHDEMVRKLVAASGVMNRNPAVNFVVAHLGDAVPAADRQALGNHDAVPLTSRVTRLFLGLQTQCTQCHDHPFNKEWVQSDFWGVNAFFRQTRRSATPTPRNGNQQQMMQLQDKIELSDDAGLNPSGIIQFEKRDGTSASTRPLFLKDYAQALEGQKSTKRVPAADGGTAKTRRQVLAEYVVGHDNFAKAYVNRIWGHLFGRGLTKEPAVDDFGSNNEVVHPELLDRLADDFKKYGYDPKQLMEAICTSDAYNLSHVANKEYADPKFDAFFARMPLKAMSPEVLFESLTVATKAEFAAGETVRGDTRRAARRSKKDAWMAKLVSNFGDDEGNELVFNGTVIQALLMMNGTELNEQITRKGGVVEQVMRKNLRGGAVNTAGVIDDLFLTALNRHATAAEVTALKDVQNGMVLAARDEKKGDDKPTAEKPRPADKGKPGEKKPPKTPAAPPKAGPTVVLGTSANDMRFYQDVLWALLNTTEFMLNH